MPLRIALAALLFPVLLAVSPGASAESEAWICACGQDRSCDVHPMIQAIARSHRDCVCNDENACSCAVHPMVSALVQAYRDTPDSFTDERCAEHPMIRSLLGSYESCSREPGCGCCEHPMIRAIMDCWQTCTGQSGTETGFPRPPGAGRPPGQP